MSSNSAVAPLPEVALEFHVEPHPDPVVQQLIEEVGRLRADNERLEHERDALQQRFDQFVKGRQWLSH